ncbi:MAG: Nitrogen-fixing NifU, C-terminal:Rieske [2Fe-2S] region [Candidatus Carbobacillus altaicus]|uniref:Nitrogen-fixing NifU, C-terminal:Rieske [2Fe-2S] region n=1 Tax=Candidatus Carbonibacillus altaicus TaxID=2163959 RepID=A0A2R6XZ71_9BACL|nr:MAG: Nitrogen-fixing NifU, C-terminal:Rieske [2Fe-2S] region [Candidatus Carbobacillus altaicus]
MDKTLSTSAHSDQTQQVRPQATTETALDHDFERLAREVDEAIQALSDMPEEHKEKAFRVKKALEAYHAHALRRLVRHVRQDEQGKALLYDALDIPAVYALFLMHGIIKQTVQVRVALALEEIRPYLHGHGGDVEIVEVAEPVVYVRLHGACSGCSLSSVTLKNAVEEAIRSRVPEITHVLMAKDDVGSGFIPLDMIAVSKPEELIEKGWVAGPSVDQLSEGKPLAYMEGETPLLFIRIEGKIMAYRNTCPHMGMPLDGGMVDGHVMTCPWHGFRYDLNSGECLSVPHIQLETYPVRVIEGRVWVRCT